MLIADVDGCLGPVAHASYDLAGLERLARLHARSHYDASVPFLTLLTGRPHGYADALTQVLDLSGPFVFENGAGLAWREPYRAELDPRAEAGLPALDALRRAIVADGGVVVQPGKVASLSFFPYPRNDAEAIDAVLARCRDAVRRLELDVTLDRSRDCVNVLLPGIDKESGFLRLLDALELAPEQVAGIGDSVGDAAWLRRCGMSCAPSPADAEVRGIVTDASELPDIEALLWFYGQVVERNRQAGGPSV